MSERISVATGTIHNSDRLDIELIESPYGRPPQVAIIWSAQPTTCEPGQLDAVVAAAMRILANSVCHPGRHPSTTKALAPQEKRPGNFFRGVSHSLPGRQHSGCRIQRQR